MLKALSLRKCKDSGCAHCDLAVSPCGRFEIDSLVACFKMINVLLHLQWC